jgi:cell division protein FtsQ
MAIKINIRRILSVTVWCFVGAGVLVLLVAAIRYRNNNTCKGYRIEISGPANNRFVDKKDITTILASAGAGTEPDRPLQSYDLHRLESALEKNVWIRKAQLFFDNNGILRVNVIERTPATRIFTTGGNSFYLDSSGVQLPLVANLPARLPVFTGYPAAKVSRQGPDSLLTAGIRKISEFISSDPFWMAQIAQIDITPERNFELEPEVGDHRVVFGDGNSIGQKFHRLFLFYKEVLSRTGFDKYQRIDVSYTGQVIATKKGSGQNRYDSVQGMDNIRQMIRSAQQLQPDTIRQQSVRPLEHNTTTEQNLTNYDLLPGNGDNSDDAPAVRHDTPPAAQNTVTHTKPVTHAKPPAHNKAGPATPGTAKPPATPGTHTPKAIMPKPTVKNN